MLTFFEQATKMMSEGDASISLSIPVVTTIMLSLKVKKGQDLGVIQLKNGLADAMDRRFSSMESVPGYTVATATFVWTEQYVFP